jgi:hypothetical protein
MDTINGAIKDPSLFWITKNRLLHFFSSTDVCKSIIIKSNQTIAQTTREVFFATNCSSTHARWLITILRFFLHQMSVHATGRVANSTSPRHAPKKRQRGSQHHYRVGRKHEKTGLIKQANKRTLLFSRSS